MPNFNLNLYLLETVGYKRCLTKLIKLHHGSQTQMKGYFFYLPDQFSWILLCNNNSGNDLGAKEPCSKNGKGNILSKQTQGSFGEMPVLRWKVPTFFWISLHLQPLLSSYPLAQQTTFFPVLPPQHCLCQHNFRAFWGRVLAVLSETWCWAMEKAAQERLFGEWLPYSRHCELCIEEENCLLGENSKELVPCSYPSSSVMAFLMDQTARDPCRCLVSPLKNPCTNQCDFLLSAYSCVPSWTLLRTLQDWILRQWMQFMT